MNWFKQWLTKKLQIDVNKQIDKAIVEDREKDRLQRQYDRKANKYTRLEAYCNRPVIVFSNELDNPVVGFGKSIVSFNTNSDPLLKVTDYLANKELLCFGKIYHYSEPLLKWYYETDPRLVLSLIYNKHFNTDANIDVILSGLYSYDVVLDILEQNGFFERLKADE